jgi:arylsulfatase A-like enzyme
MKLTILAWLACLAAGTAAEKPNLLVILADDMGWSDLGCQGSEISTPNLDRLAAEGTSFRQFYNAARCCPTRASLLTGLYPHEAGMGGMVVNRPGPATGPYQGYLNDSCTTLAEALKPAGYRSYHAGKWHVGEFRPQWPVDRGFDRAYGLISGGMNYYDIRKCKTPGLERVFARDGERIVPEADGFYATEAFTTAATGFLEEHRKDHADRPWFLYLAYTAPHWPLHAPEEIVRKYEERYRAGWQPVREARHCRQLASGAIPAGTPLSPADGAAWDKLPEEKKAAMARKMAVYAAMTEVMDSEIGRLRASLEKAGELENTLILFLSDNGACAEGGPLGANMRPDLKGPVGTVDSYHNYGGSWSNVSNTPFRRHKSHTHEGGIRTPCLVRWPAGLKVPAGSRVDAVGHVIDLMPTFCEIAGVKPPAGLAGKSLLPVLRGEGTAGPRVLGWEHFGAAAWRDGDWKLVRKGPQAGWELYDLAKDPCELADLAATDAKRAAAMAAAWGKWAAAVGVK